MIVQPCLHAHEVETKIWYTDWFIYVTKSLFYKLANESKVCFDYIFFDRMKSVFLISLA